MLLGDTKKAQECDCKTKHNANKIMHESLSIFYPKGHPFPFLESFLWASVSLKYKAGRAVQETDRQPIAKNFIYLNVPDSLD